MQLNWLAVLGTAIIPLIVGFIWYNPKVMGTVWMKAAGVSPEDAKKANMAVIFGTTIVMSLMLAVAVTPAVIHQFGMASVFEGDESLKGVLNDLLQKYGDRFRSFKHGVLHGTILGLFFATPVLTVNALFEGRKFTYIAVNAGYWIITLALMGGFICQFA